ncbi:hypothetical protein J6590_104465 [Homalodisca vitripennis]|nr:hypothetical protein J6590_104465 [Homalodisca vitripennis]
MPIGSHYLRPERKQYWQELNYSDPRTIRGRRAEPATSFAFWSCLPQTIVAHAAAVLLWAISFKTNST